MSPSTMPAMPVLEKGHPTLDGWPLGTVCEEKPVLSVKDVGFRFHRDCDCEVPTILQRLQLLQLRLDTPKKLISP